MNFIYDIIMLCNWARDGWEVHPIDIAPEFKGWI